MEEYIYELTNKKQFIEQYIQDLKKSPDTNEFKIRINEKILKNLNSMISKYKQSNPEYFV